jgi:hypothetical protein
MEVAASVDDAVVKEYSVNQAVQVGFFLMNVCCSTPCDTARLEAIQQTRAANQKQCTGLTSLTNSLVLFGQQPFGVAAVQEVSCTGQARCSCHRQGRLLAARLSQASGLAVLWQSAMASSIQ